MIMAHVDSLLLSIWIGLGLFWLAGTAFTKRTARAQPVGARLLHLAFVLPGYLLLVSNRLAIGWLGERFVPAAPWAAIAGLAVTIAGCLLAAWARLTLGANWSGRVTLKEGHELITTGPYALARHPIYTGLITAAGGTALAIGEWRGMVGVALVAFAFLTKIRQEEPLMLQAFPDAYPEYRRRVKKLIPGIL
jgi:protein-S-isoprenylcysteine O-methyltransferase Ste14